MESAIGDLRTDLSAKFLLCFSSGHAAVAADMVGKYYLY